MKILTIGVAVSARSYAAITYDETTRCFSTILPFRDLKSLALYLKQLAKSAKLSVRFVFDDDFFFQDVFEVDLKAEARQVKHQKDFLLKQQKKLRGNCLYELNEMFRTKTKAFYRFQCVSANFVGRHLRIGHRFARDQRLACVSARDSLDRFFQALGQFYSKKGAVLFLGIGEKKAYVWMVRSDTILHRFYFEFVDERDLRALLNDILKCLIEQPEVCCLIRSPYRLKNWLNKKIDASLVFIPIEYTQLKPLAALGVPLHLPSKTLWRPDAG